MPGPIQPTGRVPVAFSSVSRERLITSRSVSGAILCIGWELDSPWAMNSQPASFMASIISGWASQMPALVLAVTGKPCFLNSFRRRQKPTRLP